MKSVVNIVKQIESQVTMRSIAEAKSGNYCARLFYTFFTRFDPWLEEEYQDYKNDYTRYILSIFLLVFLLLFPVINLYRYFFVAGITERVLLFFLIFEIFIFCLSLTFTLLTSTFPYLQRYVDLFVIAIAAAFTTYSSFTRSRVNVLFEYAGHTSVEDIRCVPSGGAPSEEVASICEVFLTIVATGVLVPLDPLHYFIFCLYTPSVYTILCEVLGHMLFTNEELLDLPKDSSLQGGMGLPCSTKLLPILLVTFQIVIVEFFLLLSGRRNDIERHMQYLQLKTNKSLMRNLLVELSTNQKPQHEALGTSRLEDTVGSLKKVQNVMSALISQMGEDPNHPLHAYSEFFDFCESQLNITSQSLSRLPLRTVSNLNRAKVDVNEDFGRFLDEVYFDAGIEGRKASVPAAISAPIVPKRRESRLGTLGTTSDPGPEPPSPALLPRNLEDKAHKQMDLLIPTTHTAAAVAVTPADQLQQQHGSSRDEQELASVVVPSGDSGSVGLVPSFFGDRSSSRHVTAEIDSNSGSTNVVSNLISSINSTTKVAIDTTKAAIEGLGTSLGLRSRARHGSTNSTKTAREAAVTEPSQREHQRHDSDLGPNTAALPVPIAATAAHQNSDSTGNMNNSGEEEAAALAASRMVPLWSFDALQVDAATAGGALFQVGYSQLADILALPKRTVQSGLKAGGGGQPAAAAYDFERDGKAELESFLRRLQSAYLSNHYHNAAHAADVANSMHFLMQATDLWAHTIPETKAATCVAALGHDVGHEGKNNQFYVTTLSDLALKYNDTSVLENYHASTTFAILVATENNFINKWMSKEEFSHFRGIVISLILSTDPSTHFGDMSAFRVRLKTPDFTPLHGEDKKMLLKLLIKAADIGHAAKEWSIHLKWTLRVQQEFWEQGDAEMLLGLPQSPLCDRSNSDIPANQTGFLKYVAIPLFSLVQEAHDPFRVLQETIISVCTKNIDCWVTVKEGHRREQILEDWLDTQKVKWRPTPKRDCSGGEAAAGSNEAEETSAH
ncbi:unnamed protein product [Vitrella brassicaformis CCMP3155]|uniref:Phosphodiesterase n=2 Tax=Vitrella brassicaformis TaxID=1169539 RepID=A0A0G4E8I2_VITBC|nr:unnamed protein product [Vitrella brassicaformis CCMP3155]|eukprot:CEL91796.1 unnamed protein product [Vitrella brassicaformis CCMP3155]